MIVYRFRVLSGYSLDLREIFDLCYELFAARVRADQFLPSLKRTGNVLWGAPIRMLRSVDRAWQARPVNRVDRSRAFLLVLRRSLPVPHFWQDILSLQFWCSFEAESREDDLCCLLRLTTSQSVHMAPTTPQTNGTTMSLKPPAAPSTPNRRDSTASHHEALNELDDRRMCV